MWRAVCVGLAVSGLIACGGSGSSSDGSDDNDNTSVDTLAVAIDFSAVVGAEPLACNTDYVNVGTANTTTQIQDFRLFVHDVALITDQDEAVSVTLGTSDWQAQGVALLDFEDATGACTGSAETNATVSGTVPDVGHTFTGVRFTVGVPESLNHVEQNTVSPFNVPGMNWGWTGGYKFVRTDIPGWNLHIGSTGCAANAQNVVTCSNANRPQITLETFDYQTQTVQIDYAALVQGNDIRTDAGGAPGCMSGGTDPECNDVFTQLGLSLATGANDPALTQTVFSAAP